MAVYVASSVETEVLAAATTAGWASGLYHYRRETAIPRDTKLATFQVVSDREVAIGSNKNVRIGSALMTLIYRPTAGYGPGVTDNAAAGVQSGLRIFASPFWFADQSTIRSSPLPEVSIEQEIEIVGEVATAIISIEFTFAEY